MQVLRLNDMVKGWFVGDFTPTALRTSAAEVAVKRYAAGEREDRHVHRIASEITVVLEGEVEMNGRRFVAGDIILLEPGESTDFMAVTAATNVVVKLPSAPGDKYLVDMR